MTSYRDPNLEQTFDNCIKSLNEFLETDITDE